jgi:phosphoribosylanthranilate isomerase
LDGLLEDYKPDYLEMGMAELNLFTTLPLPVILRVEGEIPAGLRLKPRYLLVTTLEGHGDSIPLLLEVNRPGEMPDVLGERNGLALNGGSEISPGLRDYSGLAEILEQLEVE